MCVECLIGKQKKSRLLVSLPTFIFPLSASTAVCTDGDGECVALTANLNRYAPGERWVELLCSRMIGLGSGLRVDARELAVSLTCATQPGLVSPGMKSKSFRNQVEAGDDVRSAREEQGAADCRPASR